MRIIQGDISDPRVVELLHIHLISARAQTAPGSAHALDLSGLQSPNISVWTMWNDETLLGVGALKWLSGEIKSMHTAQAVRRRGVGRAMIPQKVAQALTNGIIVNWDRRKSQLTITRLLETWPWECWLSTTDEASRPESHYEIANSKRHREQRATEPQRSSQCGYGEHELKRLNKKANTKLQITPQVRNRRADSPQVKYRKAQDSHRESQKGQ
jgi:hypothetical protein